jgi:POLQ-like helicase
VKPEAESRRIFAITRAKGKMYEFGVEEADHLRVPANVTPEELLLLTVGILGDVAASVNDGIEDEVRAATDVQFAASFFDALMASALHEGMTDELQVLASAAYYLADRPGSSLVMARRIAFSSEAAAPERLVRWLLLANWDQELHLEDSRFANEVRQLVGLIVGYFANGVGVDAISELIASLRSAAYRSADGWDLLQVDIAAAVIKMRMRASSWENLPAFMGISLDDLAPTLRKRGFPKELWPSQILLGREGLFRGESGLIQMPTSAGKTRSVEIILRGALTGRGIRIAVIVAPFRALCHEIATSFRRAFRGEPIKINELSDALQLDFLEELSLWLGSVSVSTQGILILTPEKLLYVLRQRPDLVKHIGLVVYDEGHQFDSNDRGITYELLLTSLKMVLPPNAQTVIISAVIKNAEAVGRWLVGDDARIVNGAKLLPTARSVAFASWQDALGQMMFYEDGDYSEHDFFVPRVIEQVTLSKLGKESKPRHFPERAESEVAREVSLYLGIRLVNQGAVAIFCGRKDTASGMARRAAEIHARGYVTQWPAAQSDKVELARLVHLVELHFGADYFLSSAARLGIFVHHGNTPHGLRMCIEWAMQKESIRFVVCTSTLAQGVNLPIRYLIVSSTWQTASRIKNRDFQNLMGRAGRAGMHTEGLVVFADPHCFDGRNLKKERWRFRDSVSLLDPELAEDTTSALLALLDPIVVKKTEIPLGADHLLDLLYVSDAAGREEWARSIEGEYGTELVPAKEVLAELRRRRKRTYSVESFLMANRGSSSLSEYKLLVNEWVRQTLAYSLADEAQKGGLHLLFERIAEYVHATEPSPMRQAAFAKTLLGVDAAKRIDEWVLVRRDHLLALQTTIEWLDAVWELFVAEVDDKFFVEVMPDKVTVEIVRAWIEGESYKELLDYVKLQKATKPFGGGRRQVTDDDLLDFLESTLGYECALVVAAIGQSLFQESDIDEKMARPFQLFQKSLKYGLPDRLAISVFEHGFSDREVASKIREVLQGVGYPHAYLGAALRESRTVIAGALKEFPSYFEEVLESL